MKLQCLFTEVPVDQFSHIQQGCLSKFYEALAHELHDPRLGAEEPVARNLVHAYQLNPGVVREWVETFSKDSVLLRTVIASLGFQAALLLDGGELGTFDFDSNRKLDAKNAYRCGAHYLFFAIGYKSTELAIKGVSHYLHHLYDDVDYTHGLSADQSISGSLSLHGFLGKPWIPSNLSTGGMQVYVDNFLTTQRISGALLPLSPTLVSDTLADWGRITDMEPFELRFLLKHFVYNPGMRLKAQGRQQSEIVTHLEPVIDQIVQQLDALLPARQMAKWGPLFRRQVLVNLFSPFAPDLAMLDVHTHELMGHPDLVDQDIPVLLEDTFKGPLCVFNHGYAGDIYANYKRLELPLDIDMVLAGTLANGDEAYEVLSEIGRSETTDRLLAQFLEQGPAKTPEIGLLLSLHGALDIHKHGEAGQVALLVLNVMLTTQARDSALPGDTSMDWKDKFMSVASVIRQAPALGDMLLTHLERHGLPDAEILLWCGFDSRILRKLSKPAPEALSEALLCADLAL
jgi:hypothetical protein